MNQTANLNSFHSAASLLCSPYTAKMDKLNYSTVSLPVDQLHSQRAWSPTPSGSNPNELTDGSDNIKNVKNDGTGKQFRFKDTTQLKSNTTASHLTVPESASNQISAESSSNLSFIDLYGSPYGGELSAEEEQDDEDQDDEDVDDEDEANTKPQLEHPQSQPQPFLQRPSRAKPMKMDNSAASSYDRYGFKKQTRFIKEKQYDEWWQRYQTHLIRRKKKWVSFFQKNGLSIPQDSAPRRFPPRSEKLKRYIRKGIPSEWRGEAWWYFVKGSEVLQQGLYDSLVESSSGLINKDVEIIERDLNRTFPDNIHFKSKASEENEHDEGTEPSMVQSLRRVLVAFSVYQPSIGYCQSMNFIVGLLLLFMSEERAFWMLVIITSRLLPGLHEINLEGVNISQGVVMLALREYVPNVFNKLMSISFEDCNTNKDDGYSFLTRIPPVMLTTSSWFMSIFIGSLPIETTLRVWDCLFYEDSCFLFKTSLSIFKSIETKITASNIDEMEIFTIIQNYPKTILDPSTIFDIIFKSKNQFNSITQDDINRCRKFVMEKRSKDGNNNHNNKSNDDLKFNRRFLNDDLWNSDLYGFKKGQSSIINWNRNLSQRMKRRIRKNHDSG